MTAIRWIALAACAIGCGGPPRVSLSGDWPSRARDYEEVADAWTRHGVLRASPSDGFDKLLDVSATFHSPEWRTAYVAHRAKREMMPANERNALLQEQRALEEKYYEVTLLVSTHTFRENDLQKNLRSVWRLALVDSGGKEVRPVEVKRVRTPRDFVQAYYEDLDPHDKIYVARFPRESISIYGPDARRFSLKVAGARGGVELIWKAN